MMHSPARKARTILLAASAALSLLALGAVSSAASASTTASATAVVSVHPLTSGVIENTNEPGLYIHGEGSANGVLMEVNGSTFESETEVTVDGHDTYHYQDTGAVGNLCLQVSDNDSIDEGTCASTSRQEFWYDNSTLLYPASNPNDVLAAVTGAGQGIAVVPTYACGGGVGDCDWAVA